MKAIFVLALISLAQAQSINVQSFSPSHAHDFTYSQETLKARNTLFYNSKLFFASTLGTHEAPILQKNQNESSAYINRVDSLDLRAGYLFHLNHYVGLSTSANKVNLQNQESDWAMGDTNVVYIYQLPYSFAGINLATSTQLILPTGDKDLLLSDNSLGGQVSLIAQKTYRSWEAVANTGYRYTDGAQTQNLKQYNRLISSVGLNYYVNDKFSFGPEYYQEYTLDKGENNFLKFTSMNSHYAVTKNSKLFASVGSGNLRDFTNDHFRFLVGIKISAQNESPAPVPLNIQMVEKEDEVHSVYFAWNSSKLNNKFKAKLRKLSRNLKPNQKIRLSGQADQSGKSDYNTLLSKRRALAVKNYLDELGVTNRIIETSALVDGQSRKVDIIVE